MKKAFAVKDRSGQIQAVYYLEDTADLHVEETTFTRDEWNRGVAKWEWEAAVTKKLNEDPIGWELVGNEPEDLGNGFVYRIYAVRKDKFHRQGSNEIIEEHIRQWELT